MRRLKPDFWRTRLPGVLAVATALGFMGFAVSSTEPVFGDSHGALAQDLASIDLRIERADFCAVEDGCLLPGINDVFSTYRIPRYMQVATLERLYERDECPDDAKRYAFGSLIRIAVQPSAGGGRRPTCPLPDE